MIIISEGIDPGHIIPPVTHLTAFFEINKHDEIARKTLYIDMPRYFVWVKGNKEIAPHWKRRERNMGDESSEFTSNAIGRINRINLNPRQAELYYLRILLHHKTGPTCYSDLKKVKVHGEEVTCDTFKEACQKLGVLDDDTEVIKAMKDVTSMA